MQVNINIEGDGPLSDGHKEFVDRNMPKVMGSDGSVREFDPSRIKRSIIKETDVSETDADLVTGEVMGSLLTSEMSIVTAPMIREIVCSALYRRNPKWRFQYTRLGIPFYDFQKSYGKLFANFQDWRDLTPRIIMDEVIPNMLPHEICDLIMKIGRDFLGVKNNIGEIEFEE